mmetsp:Transcript_31012/g.68512  ORF Transcript_31012/g.68512 Transcript_31012/m.68512 type:complete len:208 (+) Transcript_31012:580-1203(+)
MLPYREPQPQDKAAERKIPTLANQAAEQTMTTTGQAHALPHRTLIPLARHVKRLVLSGMMTSRLSTEKVSPARAAEKAAEIEIGVTAGPDRSQKGKVARVSATARVEAVGGHQLRAMRTRIGEQWQGEVHQTAASRQEEARGQMGKTSERAGTAEMAGMAERARTARALKEGRGRKERSQKARNHQLRRPRRKNPKRRSRGFSTDRQ